MNEFKSKGEIIKIWKEKEGEKKNQNKKFAQFSIIQDKRNYMRFIRSLDKKDQCYNL